MNLIRIAFIYFLFISQLYPAQSFKEHFLKPDDVFLKAFFSHKDNIIQLMTDLIDEEQQGINIMAYFLTEKQIARALQRAHENKRIPIKIVIDHSMATNSDYNKTLKKLCPFCDIRVYQPAEDGIMHNKIALFKKNIADKSFIWTGSFNFTFRAQNKNIENVIISDNALLIKQYQETFDTFYEKSVEFSKVDEHSSHRKGKIKIEVTTVPEIAEAEKERAS